VLSRRALGIFALAAVILAAISFAVVDVNIANANGCVGVSGPCSDTRMPLIATAFAILGTIALLLSVVPAVRWFLTAIHHQSHDDDIEPVRVGRASYTEEEEL
jgi:hypothetical protein